MSSLQGARGSCATGLSLRQLWIPTQRAWYPQGLDDEHLSILRVTSSVPNTGRRRGKASFSLAAVAATVTGKPATVAPGHKLS